MAASRLVVALFQCSYAFLLFTLPAVGEGAAVTCNIRAGNFIQSGTIAVNISCPNSTVNVTSSLPNGMVSNFTNVTLPYENGPDSYWNITVTCVETPHVLSTPLFLSSDAGVMNYSVYVYANCTAMATPSVWVDAVKASKPKKPKLGIDEARLDLVSKYPQPVSYSQLSDNCYKCKAYELGILMPGETKSVYLDTTFAWTIYINNISNVSLNNTEESSTLICSIHHTFVEHSIYQLQLQLAEDTRCHLNALNRASRENVYLPILYASVCIVVLAVLWGLGTLVWRFLKDRRCAHYLHVKRVDRVTARDLGNPKTVSTKYGAASPQETEPLTHHSNSSLNNSTLLPEGQVNNAVSPERQQQTSKAPKKTRLVSLDAFRGFSLMIMIFVNYGGGGYWFFNHSRWNGLTVADLVFPWFVWIMGVSIVFSYKGRRKDSILSRLYQLLRRTIILFGLGIFLNNGYDLSHWRIPGVLQRFSISYFVVALTELVTSELVHHKKHWFIPEQRYLRPFRDLTSNVIQWVMVLVLEFIWLMITFLMPVHGCPTGYLGPGGLSDYGRYYNCTGGAAGAIDKWLFKQNHLYQTPTAKDLYKLIEPYDPEGALGSINSIVICFLGVQAGRILIHYKSPHNILLRFLTWGVFLGGLATILCEGQKNEGIIPLNKNLWSLSFILAMAGSGFVLLAMFYLFIDVIRWWNGAPFKYPGMNSIMVYVGSEIVNNFFPFSWEHQNDSHLNLLFANLIGVSIWIAIAYYWYWIGFFVKI